MKKIVFNGLLLIGIVMSAHTIFCMEDPVEVLDEDRIKKLLISPYLDIKDTVSYLVYLSYYANALLKQDEVVNEMRSLVALKKIDDSIHEKQEKLSVIPEETGMLMFTWKSHESLMLILRHSIVRQFHNIKREYSPAEIIKVKNAKNAMQKCNNPELESLILLCDRIILRSQLLKKYNNFLTFIKMFHVKRFDSSGNCFLYNNLSVDLLEKSLEKSKSDFIKNANYSELVKIIKYSPDIKLKFEKYSYLLTFYSNLPLNGKINLITLESFVKFIDQSDFANKFCRDEFQQKLDFYDKNKAHYIQVYQEILAFLKQEVKKNASIREVLNFQESSPKGIEAPLAMRMPEVFPEWQPDKKVMGNDQTDFLPDYLKQSIKKSPSKAKGKAKGKGRNKNVSKPKIKQKFQPKQKVHESQQLQLQKIEKIAMPDTASDGSYLLKNNEDYMFIADPKNSIKVRVLKSDQKSSVSLSAKQQDQLVMTNWVKEWYENPDNALNYQGYKNIENPKYTPPELYEQVTTYHTPALILLKYLRDLAQQQYIDSRKVQNKKDILFTMPVINFYDDKQVDPGKSWQSGVVAWIVDSADNQTIYHTEFRPTQVSKMIQSFMQDGYFQISFPTLSEVQEYNQQ